jgi:hypothetical protein
MLPCQKAGVGKVFFHFLRKKIFRNFIDNVFSLSAPRKPILLNFIGTSYKNHPVCINPPALIQLISPPFQEGDGQDDGGEVTWGVGGAKLIGASGF